MIIQGYEFYSGIVSDSFNAKANKKDQGHTLGAPRYLQQRVCTASQSSLET